MIVKKIDSVGRIVIPMELRKSLNWKDNDIIILEESNGSLLLTKQERRCILCGEQGCSDNRLVAFKDKTLCENCIRELKSIDEI